MPQYIYSKKTNAFYPLLMQDDYEAAGSWPEDGVEVKDDIYLTYVGNPPAGKTRGANKDGLPSWVDIPALTHQQQLALAEQERTRLLAYTSSITADWRTELSLDVISDEDKTRLIAWMKYIKDVKAVDISTAPDIAWPVKPTE